MHARNAETWIKWRTLVNRGWLPMPRHAHGGRHAAPVNARGTRTLARVYGNDTAKRMRLDQLTRNARPAGRTA